MKSVVNSVVYPVTGRSSGSAGPDGVPSGLFLTVRSIVMPRKANIHKVPVTKEK
jgi:hypothetical protein